MPAPCLAADIEADRIQQFYSLPDLLHTVNDLSTYLDTKLV
jgi:hypothetical protein